MERNDEQRRTPIALFDLDGTLANIEHRLHWINGKHEWVPNRDPDMRSDCAVCGRERSHSPAIDIAEKNNCKKNWDEFYEACGSDKPIDSVMAVCRSLLGMGHKVGIVSGRRESTRATTGAWLKFHWLQPERFEFMMLRPDGDSTPDSDLKLVMLEEIRELGYEPFIVFDDRQKVVDMWRAEGIVCAQVAPGKF